MMSASHVRKRHISLSTQQHRLRHLRGISARNISHDVIPEKLRDDYLMYFTINLTPSNKVIYTSEPVENNLNPDWGHFEMSHFPDNVSSSASVIQIKIWCCQRRKYANNKDYIDPQLIIEWTVNFTGLHYLGEQIPKDSKCFMSNTVVCLMIEGHYSCENSLLAQTRSKISGDYVYVEDNAFKLSYNLSSIQRIHTIQRAMAQTKGAVQREWDHIRSHLANFNELKILQSEKEQANIRINLLLYEKKKYEDRIKDIREKLLFKKKCQYEQSLDLSRKFESLEILKEELIEDERSTTRKWENLIRVESLLSLRWKQLISELSIIYPVEKDPDSNYFEVRGIKLPNSEALNNVGDIKLSVAIGFVAHILIMITRFLNVPLRYQINLNGSRSVIYDYCAPKLQEEDRVFPLFCKGKDRLRFYYAIYLLNKNIAQLRHYSGLSTVDLGATLQNLHNLLLRRFSFTSDGLSTFHGPMRSHSKSPAITIFDQDTNRHSSVESDNSVHKDSQEIQLKANGAKPSLLSKTDESVHAVMAKEASSALGKCKEEGLQNKHLKLINTNYSYSLDQGLNHIQSSSQNDSHDLSVTTSHPQNEALPAYDRLPNSNNDSSNSANIVSDASNSKCSCENSCSCPVGKDLENLSSDVDYTFDDCDIKDRVQYLASRSGSFKQLQLSKSN